MPVTRRSSVPNLQRGMAILEYLATHQRSATIAELSERLGYPSASVFRITQAFTELGYLSRDPVTKQFRLTNKLLLLGQPQSRGPGLVEASIAAMRELNRATGETTQLCCLVDTGVVVLEQLLALHPFKYSAELGARCPAYSCAPGKAILAGLPDEERDDLLRRIRFKRFTPTTITDRRLFREELAAIRDCGFAVDRAEGMAGIHCVAAAICDRNRIPVGALTIAAPASRVKEEDFARVGKLVIKAARTSETNYGQ
ncbi:IclR family transcriptional regulator [Maioricimonas sp. JC845]|uniref:IclR family transcriptional regulator n=1 Tax=Maioricimonas sp. JC845 TaxID=3232138 RepID=UPI00345953FD